MPRLGFWDSGILGFWDSGILRLWGFWGFEVQGLRACSSRLRPANSEPALGWTLFEMPFRAADES